MLSSPRRRARGRALSFPRRSSRHLIQCRATTFHARNYLISHAVTLFRELKRGRGNCKREIAAHKFFIIDTLISVIAIPLNRRLSIITYNHGASNVHYAEESRQPFHIPHYVIVSSTLRKLFEDELTENFHLTISIQSIFHFSSIINVHCEQLNHT